MKRKEKPTVGRAFIEYYRAFPRVEAIWDDITERLSRVLPDRGFSYPCKGVFFRVFKDEEIVELWLKRDDEIYGLWSTYPICAISGTLGPKRREGDYQIPEGFYRVERFNPLSRYHLSMGIDYPNASDRILGDPKEPGTDIFIHGGCVTVGCMPITDRLIEEPFILSILARGQGQLINPFHIFPARLEDDVLEALSERFNDADLTEFWRNLQPGYKIFEDTRIPPNPSIDMETGKYLF